MSKKAMTLALEEFKHIKQWCLRSIGIGLVNENVLTALEEALAKQEQGEPDDLTIAYMAGLNRGKDLAPQPAQKPWVGLMRGVRVEGDTVVISVHYGNDAARQLCADLIKEMNT